MIKWIFNEPLNSSRATISKAERANMRKEYKKFKIFIIVNTTSLLQQLTKQLKNLTILKVAKYHGNETKYTNSKEWNKEFVKHDVFIIIAKVFLEYLRHGLVQMSLIDLLIFDDCDFASGNSDYNNIMKEYYFQ